MSGSLRSSTLFAALALALCGCLATSTAQADSKIGGVNQKEYKGATGAPSGGAASPLYFANDVFSGETVSTPDAGSTMLVFQDSTELNVGANSTVVLDKYVFDPSRHVGEGGVNFSKGIFRFVTGSLKNKEGYDLFSKGPDKTEGTADDIGNW